MWLIGFSPLCSAMFERALVTGGAGFIGGHLVDRLLTQQVEVICVDKLTYAGNQRRLSEQIERGVKFHQVDLADGESVELVVRSTRPDVVFHLAAESHVDRSIDEPEAFIKTNIIGTSNLLKACLRLQNEIDTASATDFRLISVSTDEVFGSAKSDEYFQPSSRYQPRSPYAASKAAADHLVSAWHHTFGLNAIVTNCSNNYGPFQFPEKLIPHIIIRALLGQDLPVYGDGEHQRDWIHVNDHVEGLIAAAREGEPGDTYLFGGRAVMSNLALVEAICQELETAVPGDRSFLDRIEFVPDRPGHDLRYAIDPSESERALGWRAKVDFEIGLRETVSWYVANESWWREILDAGYKAGRIGRGQ